MTQVIEIVAVPADGEKEVVDETEDGLMVAECLVYEYRMAFGPSFDVYHRFKEE